MLDAVHKVLALYDEQRHQLGGVGLPHAHLREVHVLLQQFLRQFLQVIDFGHRDDGEFPQVGIDHDRLRVRVADDTNTRLSLKRGKLRLELRAEVGTLQTMDRAYKPLPFCVSGHTAPFGS